MQVRMSAMELASRNLSAWRQAKSEEFSKGKFLDVETAAKFSTAAAAQLADRRRAALAAIAPDKAGTLALDSGASARDEGQARDDERPAAAARSDRGHGDAPHGEHAVASQGAPGDRLLGGGGRRRSDEGASRRTSGELPVGMGSTELPSAGSLQPDVLAATDMRDAEQHKVGFYKI